MTPLQTNEQRVLVSGGGTAGHVLPALSVLTYLMPSRQDQPIIPTSSGGMSDAHSDSGKQALPANSGPVWRALFVGSVNGMEGELVTRASIPFVAIHSGGIAGVGAAQQARSMLAITRGFFEADRVVRAFKPHVTFLTGGFVGVPVSLASQFRGVPSVVYLPDVEPGMAVRFMNRFATKVATTTAASATYVPAAKMVVTGYPVREAFFKTNKQIARAYFGIPMGERVVLVFGGSKGAQSINHVVTQALGRLLHEVVVIHVTGQNGWDDVKRARESLPTALKAKFFAFPYLHDEMTHAMAAADLAVCRSGASSLGELPLLGLPAVLVPYPYAWRYQRVNAMYLEHRNAAVVLDDATLGQAEGGLIDTILGLSQNSDKLAQMSAAMKSIQTSEGARNIAALLGKVIHHD